MTDIRVCTCGSWTTASSLVCMIVMFDRHWLAFGNQRPDLSGVTSSCSFSQLHLPVLLMLVFQHLDGSVDVPH